MRIGAFEGALDLNLTSFRDFPEVIRNLGDERKKTPVVMYCTGGVRCEKASSVMLREGFESVYQLEGGILNYFSECGGAHWKGECFVFDQ